MNREDLFAAMTEIKDEYIEEANPAKRVPVSLRRKLRPYLGLAAALVVVIGLVALAGKINLIPTKDTTAEVPAYAEDGTAQTTAQTESGAGEYSGETEEGGFPEEAAAEEPEAPSSEEPAEDTIEQAAEEETEAKAADRDASEEAALVEEAPEESVQPEDWQAPRRPEEILWNGTAYHSTGEMLYESPAGFADAGMLSNESDAEFYADDPASSGYSIYTSEADLSRLYLAVPEGFLCYARES